MAQADLIPGVEITLGTRKLTMPPCGMNVLSKNWTQIQALQQGGAMGVDQIHLVTDIVHGALRRNYPELTRDEVETHITLDNLQGLTTQALSQSLPPVPQVLQGEGAGSGESTGISSGQS